MALIRFVAIVAICASATLFDVRSSFAQDLSNAALAISSDRSGGYMALGGHLGKAISKRARAKETVSKQRPRVRRSRKVVTVAYRREVTASYLVAESLDPTGLNIAGLNMRYRGP